ncbi:NADP-dependent oxidoreductase [Pseudonocardia spinosispora]|uniref:NADP-dependent oxidoreductase n=1 Tax=Pseudonocardia spinosispora TaxID=103441 RepID=UPI0003FF61E0|nr:NADP-dependent oxidoreductase [Pseudonocardia spinosispora]
MTEAINHQVRLAQRPKGDIQPSDWAHTDESVPTIGDGQFLVRISHISLDPAMRGWLNDAPSYIPPVGIDEVMRAFAAGEVMESNHPSFTVGSHVTGVFGVQEYAVSDGSGVLAVDPSTVPLPTWLSALGITGLTAYFGLFDVGALADGETVLVSGAAGAVGTVVGQLAKIKGARVVGIAGGPEKCRWVTEELGFDDCLDYRQDGLSRRLHTAIPKGVDVFFDNVGGEVLDAGLAQLNRGARVVICGAISQYNLDRVEGPRNYMNLLVKRARMEGFLVFDFADRYGDAAKEIAGWLAEGKLRSEEDIVQGTVADFPATLQRLFRGENKGKLILAI